MQPSRSLSLIASFFFSMFSIFFCSKFDCLVLKSSSLRYFYVKSKGFIGSYAMLQLLDLVVRYQDVLALVVVDLFHKLYRKSVTLVCEEHCEGGLQMF